MIEKTGSPIHTNYAYAAGLVWTLLATLAGTWSAWRESAITREIATAEARAIYNTDQAFRSWAVSHGGVYVPTDENTPANPHLAHIANHDITTPSGLRLTLMNPSYIVRQMHDQFRDLYGVRGHMTSLRPLRLLNAPDPWERKALEAFEQGKPEVSELAELDGKPYLRLMRPLVTTEQCLNCHSHQGYRVGDIRGGASVSLPMKPLLAQQRVAIAGNVIVLAATWLAGLGGIVWARRLFARHARQIEKAESVLRTQRDLAAQMSSISDLSEALTLCLDTALRNSHLDCGAIYLATANAGLDLAIHTGLSTEFLRNVAHYSPDSPRTQLALQGRPVYAQYEDLPLSLESGWLAEGLRALAILPIQHDGRVIACMNVGSRTMDVIPPAVRQTLEAIGSQIGAGIARIHAETGLRVLIRAVEQSSSTMVITNCNGAIEFVNPRFVATTGYTAGEAIGKTPSILKSGEQPDEFYAQLWQTITSGKDWRGEFHNRRKDGTLYWEAATISPVTDGRGQITHFAAIKDDITEQKRQEEELKCYAAALEQFNCLAESATRAKSEFLANMSHEIRTPITAILGYADVLADSPLPPSQQDAIEIIKRNGDHLLAIINDILDLSKIEAGKLHAELITCCPQAILDDVTSLMQVHAETKGLILKSEFVGPIPRTIRTDPTRLQQILYNLVSNAIKFTETGGVRIVSRLLEHDTVAPGTVGPTIQCEVIDTGIGMSPDQCERLFRPFEQADSSTTRKFGGTGLGLAISKRLAEMLGGDITVSSTPGQGSAFRVTIPTGPLDGVPMLDQPSETTARVARRAKPVWDDQIRLDCRILLAEDGPDNQRLIAFLLQKAGAHVVLADNGQIACAEACAANARGEPFDLILMDVQMPVMDGYDATRRLRAEEYHGPIIAVTAHAMADHRQKCLDAGCDDYITKPIDRQKLLTTIAQWLARTETQTVCV